MLALKGRRQVGCITSADRGVSSTACMCVSATGHFIPPMLIFPRARLTDQLKKGAPVDSIFSCNESGWMTGPNFNLWFNHFLKHTRPTAESPVLLLLDGHASHIKNLTFIEKARSNSVTVICFPPHCSHKLQPLDVAFMGPFKTHYSQILEKLLKDNPGKIATLNDISGLVGEAFLKTAVPITAVNAFKKTGIVPFNRYIFNDTDFAPSMVTDLPMDDDDSDGPFLGFEDEIGESSSAQPSTKNPQLNDVATSSSQQSTSQGNPGSQEITNVDPCRSATVQPTTGKAFNVSPDEIHPLPKTRTRKLTRKRRSGKTAIITESPYRNELQKASAAKDIASLQKDRRKRLISSSKAASETPKRGRGRPKGTTIKRGNILQDSLCEFCGDVFSASEEGCGWQKCPDCNTWFHDCNGVNCPSCQ